METNAPHILVLVGPTACHKTETAVTLCRRFSGEVVSADSVQVYTGMDIGSAKPTIEEQKGVPHHMIDCVPIDAPSFSVSQFRQMAVEAIDGILHRGRLPVVVGGSGLYVNALISPLGFAAPSDMAVRTRLETEYDQSPETVIQRLFACDPITANRLHPNDKKRIVRALEVFECSGKPLSAFGADFVGAQQQNADYHAALIGLTMDREALYARIDRRVDMMIQRGLLKEAEQIYRAGYNRMLPAMQSIGYRQLFDYFDGDCTLAEATERIKRETRRFAKRQLTWFRRDARIRWVDVTAYTDETADQIEQLAKELL